MGTILELSDEVEDLGLAPNLLETFTAARSAWAGARVYRMLATGLANA